MRILVCVKRVPMTGGKIVLSEDAQAIETKHLGFTISPHEECGVEEAVRLIEAHGGESVVLTLGPPEAEEQLRDAMATRSGPCDPPRLGRRGVGPAGDGRARSSMRSARTRRRAGRSTSCSSATSRPIRATSRSGSGWRTRSEGRWQPGSRASSSRTAPCVASRRSAGGRDVYALPLPAVVTVLEGLNLPRYPSVPAKLRAQRKPVAASSPARPESRLEKLRLVVPEGQGKEAEILGHGPEAAPAVVEVLRRIGVA